MTTGTIIAILFVLTGGVFALITRAGLATRDRLLLMSAWFALIFFGSLWMARG